ncbi:MAG: putative membrane protein [Cenarchaeum symbiont of Oopsacas minuta]|nr:putative membrane protein [Cenarchaeum symbiont of Oopsacas minuta]
MLHSLVLAMIFSNVRYVILACGVFTTMFFALNYIAEYLFISPYLVLHVPTYEIVGFFLIVLVASLIGLVISMAIYSIQMLKSKKTSTGSSVTGSVIGIAAGTCSCGPVGFTLFSIFGTIGGTATLFLTNYEIPLRLVSVAILVATYFYMVKTLNRECSTRYSNSQV